MKLNLDNAYILTSDGELYHYGVKGQKWGVRVNIKRLRREGMLLKDIAAVYGVGTTTIQTICKGGV